MEVKEIIEKNRNLIKEGYTGKSKLYDLLNKCLQQDLIYYIIDEEEFKEVLK